MLVKKKTMLDIFCKKTKKVISIQNVLLKTDNKYL